ncbi:MAG: hypothetical protein K2J66_04615 [Muribaculaceae bacterium]|nr:hypothetical protein [Muribaculaceae bacterium]
MRKTVVILLSVISLVFAVETVARRQRTTRGNVVGRNVTGPGQAAVDTFIIPDNSEVLLYGYDKPLRSRQETVFVANHTLHDITGLTFTTRYIDTKGRTFHQVSRRVRADIPSGATRKIDYRSWDTQQSFYYVGSRRTRASGTPYDVRLSVDTAFVSLTGQ